MNVIGNIAELTDSYDPSANTHKPIELVIEEIKEHSPSDLISIPYKDGGDLLFEFKHRTCSGICVYQYTGSVS